MVQSRIEIILEVWNKKANTWKRWYVDTEGVGSIPLTFNINDIKDLAITKGGFSKTINLPETARNRQVFSDITDLNSDGTFSAGKRQRAYVLIDTVMVFDGFFTLTEFVIDDFNSTRTINLNIYADNNDFFSVMGEEYIETLDLSRFNHIYNSTNISQSWLPSQNYLNRGYYYPLIDYGYDWNANQILQNGPNTEDFYAANYARNVWDQIFFEAGFTWKSSSLTQSTPFDDLIIPFVNGAIDPEPDYVQRRQFRAGMSTFQNITSGALYPANILGTQNTDTLSQNWFWQTQLLDEVVRFNDDTTPPNGDPNGVWNTTLWTWTNSTAFPQTGRFGFSMEIDQTRVWSLDFVPLLQLEMNTGSGWQAVATDASWINTLYLPVASNSNSGWTITNPQPHGNPTGNPGYEKYQKNFYTPQFLMPAGAQVRLRYKYRIAGNISQPVPAGYVMAVIKNNSYIFNEPNPQVLEGMPIIMSNMLPKKFKRKDFILSIIKMFNLIVEPDKVVKNQLNIETREAYYAAGPIKDWSRKVDKRKPITGVPLAETQTRRINLKYKDDKDFFNTDYKNKTGLSYGEKQYQSDNELITGAKTMEISFSPTPLVAIPLQGGNPYGGASASNIVIPKIGITNNGQFQRTAANPRILIKKAAVPCQPWSAFQITQTTYPYAGHLDDHLNPTIDINFDQTRGVYFPQATTTANTLWRAFWQSQIEETFHDTSRIVKCHIFLTPEEVWNFRFNWNIYIDFGTGGQYYKVNKIEGWEAGITKSVEVELIKTKTIKVGRLQPFKLPWNVLTSGIIDNGGNGLGSGGFNSSQRTTAGNSQETGSGNQFIGDGMLIAGSGNRAQGASSIVVGDANNVVGERVMTFGASNSVSGADIFISGEGNNITSNKSYVFGSGNTIASGGTSSTDRVFIFGDGVITSNSNAFIVQQPIIQYANALSADVDTILGENPDNILINYISAGRDAIRGLGSKSQINFVDAGRDKII